MLKKMFLPDKFSFPALLKLVCCFIPAALIELAYRYTLPYVNLIEGGERKLILLIHAAALLSTLLLLYRPRLPRLLRYLSIAAAPGVSFFLMEYITHFAPRDISIPIIILNLVLYYLLGLFLLFLFGRSSAAVAIVTIFPVCVGFISYYVMQFRGNPLLPWDIGSFTTAMGVVSNYTFLPTIRGAFVFAIAIFQVVLGIKCSERVLGGKLPLRLSLSAAVCALLVGSCFYVRSDHCIRTFSLDNTSSDVSVVYTRNGFMVAFLVSSNYGKAPENYSLDMIDDFASAYPSDQISTQADEERPNVIVIMNESYSDLRVLGDYETSEPLFPFIDSLEENTAKGWAHVSVLGGNTPNSEFEFLTGLTLGFLPQGVVAYPQYISTPVPSLATQFNSLGYRTVGAHAFWGPSWNRDKVYPLLGFQDMYFKEAFPEDAEILRLWITDSEMYKVVEDIYEDSEQPLFLFGITMMNHGGYHGEMNDEFDTCVTVDGLEDNGSVTEYISLMRETDKDFQELIEYFSNTDEKTVILLFGDHQPNDDVAAPIMELTGSAVSDDPTQHYRRYITPYVLWANYDVDFDLPEDLSLNYLAAELMKACGLELTGAQKYLLDLVEEYPVISSQCYWDAQGKVHYISEYTDEEALTEYACIQHNYLLDSRNRREEFWTLAD